MSSGSLHPAKPRLYKVLTMNDLVEMRAHQKEGPSWLL